jgi:ankyrin repeat protein
LAAVQLLLSRGARARPLPPCTPPLSEVHWRWQPGSQEAGDALAIARALLAAGADVDADSGSHLTPLSNAAYFGCLAGVRLLLEAGAKAGAVSDGGLTPLQCAVHCRYSLAGPPGCIEALLDAGADATAASSFGLTPLHRVGSDLHPDHAAAAARLLLAAGADVDARDEYGDTSLALAARPKIDAVEFTQGGHARVARALQAVGADPAACAFWARPNIAALPRRARAELMWEAAWARRGVLRMLRRRVNPNSVERDADEEAAAAAAAAEAEARVGSSRQRGGSSVDGGGP